MFSFSASSPLSPLLKDVQALYFYLSHSVKLLDRSLGLTRDDVLLLSSLAESHQDVEHNVKLSRGATRWSRESRVGLDIGFVGKDDGLCFLLRRFGGTIMASSGDCSGGYANGTCGYVSCVTFPLSHARDRAGESRTAVLTLYYRAFNLWTARLQSSVPPPPVLCGVVTSYIVGTTSGSGPLEPDIFLSEIVINDLELLDDSLGGAKHIVNQLAVSGIFFSQRRGMGRGTNSLRSSMLVVRHYQACSVSAEVLVEVGAIDA
ncbi:hypothetical protein Tco_0157626 [Tanacetum coccineum]